MSSLPAGQPILDSHHHLWEHPEKPYMMAQLRADIDTVFRHPEIFSASEGGVVKAVLCAEGELVQPGVNLIEIG